MNGTESFFIKVFSFLITLMGYATEAVSAIVIALVIIAVIIETYQRIYYEFKLNKIKKKKKKYSNTDIYNIIDQEFNRKIHRCIWQQSNSINIEYMDKKEAKRREMELHTQTRQKLSEIKEKISNQDNTNINIDSIKLKLTEVFKNILSITILREFIFYDTKDLNNRYKKFIILLIYTKMIADIQSLDKKTQEAIESEKEEISIIETINYLDNKYNYDTSKFINTVEEFSEITKNIFRNFNELYSICMPQQETREEPVNNTNKESSKESNKTEEQEIVNKYRVII